MNTLSRRNFLQGAPVVAAGALTPTICTAALDETPAKKVNRLGWELAHALNDYADGAMHAEIYPASKGALAVGLKIDYPETQEEKVRRLVRNLQYEMSKLPTMMTGGGETHEIQFSERSYLRLGTEGTLRDGVLVMVGLVPPLPSGTGGLRS